MIQSNYDWKYIPKKDINLDRPIVSITKKLLEENKINQDFIDRLSFLTYEEIIALKLETCVKMLGTPFLGFSLWHKMKNIYRDALFKFVYSLNTSSMVSAAILGISREMFAKMVKKYKPELYFQDYLKVKEDRKEPLIIKEEIMEKIYAK